MPSDQMYVLKKSDGVVTLDADFDGTESDVFDMGVDKPIKTLLLSGLDSSPTLTFKVYDSPSGTGHVLYGDDGNKVSIATTDANVAVSCFKAGAARFMSVVASATQTDVVIKGVFSS